MMEREMGFDSWDGGLIPGMYGETKVYLREKKDAITVPVEGVKRNGDDATVLVVNARNEIEERHIKLGLEDSSRVEVVSGLSDRDRVIIGNRAQFHNGQKIVPKEVSAGEPKPGGQSSGHCGTEIGRAHV